MQYPLQELSVRPKFSICGVSDVALREPDLLRVYEDGGLSKLVVETSIIALPTIGLHTKKLVFTHF